MLCPDLAWLGWVERAGMRLYPTAQNSEQFKTYLLFASEISHRIFLGYG